jgi:uncharacterized membrane protein YcaP (DUF421 family)
MEWFAGADWEAIFIPTVPLAETFIRGSVIYLFLFFMLRVFRRQAGTISITDLLVIVLIADASQNGMAGDYKAVPDGMALVATLIFWDYLLDWLGYHVPCMEKLLQPPPVPLIRKGRILHRNMRSQLISHEDLMGQLRQQGVEDVTSVKQACLEGDGKISIIKMDEPPSRGPQTKLP